MKTLLVRMKGTRAVVLKIQETEGAPFRFFASFERETDAQNVQRLLDGQAQVETLLNRLDSTMNSILEDSHEKIGL